MAKIRRKQEMMEERRKRILNARTRTIGVDVAALDAQCAERRQNRADDQEANRIERLRTMEIERVLAGVEEEERQLREYEQKEIKASWERSLAGKQERDAHQSMQKDIDFEDTGISAAVQFAGEDPHRRERLMQQREQMRKWAEEQLLEKQRIQSLEKDEDQSYASVLRQIDQIREDNEADEAAMRRAVRLKFVEENTNFMLQKRAIIADGKAESDKDTNASLPIIEERNDLAMDAGGRIIRKDMFKGYTLDQQRRMLQENEALKEAKYDSMIEQQEEDQSWALQQALSQRAMEEAYNEEKVLRSQRKEEYLASLRDQIVRDKEAKAEWEKTKIGNIGNRFFNAFGTSAR